MKKTCKNCENNPRLGKVGGQAVLEGVMMRSGENVSVSVRAEDGSVQTKDSKYVSIKQKYKVLGLPIIRGMVSFIESMVMSFGTMNDSVNLLGIEEEETKFEKWLIKKFGASILDVLMPIAMVLGVLLAVGLFVFLPALIGRGISYLFGGDIGIWQSAIEGVMKVAIFIVYMLLVSMMKDIRRTFEYHGAEHKSIFCYESGEELTVENVKKHSRFHPRCGTSFMFVMIFIGIVLGFFIPFETVWLRTLCKILLLPVTMGIGYEFLMYAGKHDNFLIRALSAPGLWMQRITTKEPDDSQIEVAIASLKHALPDDFPDREELRLRLEAEKASFDEKSTEETEA
ncbi:MAG: DUF1385 domain-containing protein [Clostridia bacterium]|nr:DUF1385 domain-containing protein [Clostridia bacterium]